MLEVIVETLADALASHAGGASQLDCKAALPLGGLTPSLGMVEQICRSVDTDALVTIRPHARSFCFTPPEIAVMCGDIMRARDVGASGFLTGCLTEKGAIDVEAMTALQEAAGKLPVHFHLAWELVPSPVDALDTLVGLGVKSVRTSGGGLENVAVDRMDSILGFSAHAAGRIELVLAGGVTLQNVGRLVAGTGVPNVHVGRAARTPETRYGAVDAAKVRSLSLALQEASALL